MQACIVAIVSESDVHAINFNIRPLYNHAREKINIMQLHNCLIICNTGTIQFVRNTDKSSIKIHKLIELAIGDKV